ncbi:hypothetical protein V2J09_001388 [Rumex salicifolius]
MIEVMNSGRELENCLDPQLWHACAGGMVQMPPVNSKVIYFPQGHIEHAQVTVDSKTYPRVPPLIPSRIASIKYLADRDSDEVFAKIKLVPLRPHELDFGGDDGFSGVEGTDQFDGLEKPASFAKTLTQSDANNGGGFSVPRYCAETIFPRLDYSAEPPVQTILARDVHGVTWKFRHIYRGTPRRHLLTTGWSNFVNQKKLVAGDSIVFLRAENGDLCVGIRRAKKGIGGGPESPSGGWNGCGGGYSAFLRDDESRMMMMRRMNSSSNGGLALGPGGKVGVESVVEAANLAANGQPFEVVYYPRASTPEFCVKASSVKATMQIQWCPGMRFKMAFETEDSSRISWFMGTISGVQVADPVHWPNSPWRLLQVAWDEPELLQNVKRVNPWLVEMVASMPSIHMSPFSPPRKKMRIPQPHDYPFLDQLPKPSSPFCCVSDNISAGIQGARHAQFGQSPFTNLGKVHSGFFPALLKHPEIAPPVHHHHHPLAFPGHSFLMTKPNKAKEDEDVSCLLTMGSCNESSKPKFMLFGKPILTEEQISQSSSGDSSSNSTTPSKNVNKGSVNRSDGSSSGQTGSSNEEALPQKRDEQCKTELGLLEGGHCNMFGVERPDMLKNVNHKPFSEFLKTARTLSILADAGSENLAR